MLIDLVYNNRLPCGCEQRSGDGILTTRNADVIPVQLQEGQLSVSAQVEPGTNSSDGTALQTDPAVGVFNPGGDRTLLLVAGTSIFAFIVAVAALGITYFRRR